MKIIIRFVFYVWIGSAVSLAFGNEDTAGTLVYRRTSDASAAVAVGQDMFIVADDENNVLRVYKTTKGGLPLFSYNMTEFLGIDPEHPEVDIEGATIIGQRIYWISSHGRNKDGKMRPNRYRFFATTFKVENGNVTITPIGTPCKTLIHSLVKAENMRYLRLDRATRFDVAELPKKERKKLAPKEEGLNIEGFCSSADGRTIYIGFRNPRLVDRVTRHTKALVVPLNNPKQVIEDCKTPIFGELMSWDLAGLGIRSMEYSHFHKVYLIIAGSFDDSPKFALYRWSGKKEKSPVIVRRLSQSDFSPEAMVTFNNSDRFFVLSDDGSLHIKVDGAWECMKGEFRKDGTCQNKYLIDPEKKTFRGIWLTP
ncbi:MAG: DUF3616 domain-containing protein [Planctomycetes bacterium]|nr:DUF3616 domain-containing protein [Planctomycetota bacterium]